MRLEETTRVTVPPEAVYGFFEVMESNYERWHPDHIEFRWIDGDGLAEGAMAYFEERIAGELQSKTVRFIEIVPSRYIEFTPTAWLTSILMPSISFTLNPHEAGCDVTQRIKIRTGPIGAWFNRREFDAVRRHMNEEGENLKTILETEAARAD